VEEINNYSDKSKEYEKSLSSEYKKQNGIFYTDLFLSNKMMDELKLEQTDIRIIDPTCGTGSFIISALNKGFKNVYGLDIDRGAIKVCKSYCPDAKIKVFDSLSKNAMDLLNNLKLKEKFDVIIGNPPYASLKKDALIATEDYLFLRTVKTSGDNLFIAALLRAKELIRDGGVISYIIPKNFLHVNSYSLLRREILRDFTIKSIVDIGSYFRNVRGEQIILTIQKQKKRDNETAIKKLIDDEFELKTTIRQDFYTDEIILFESKEDVTIYQKFRQSYTTLNDYVTGYVGRGKSKSKDAVSGKDIRKFGLKSGLKPEDGNQIFIQNIYSSESGIIACFGGKCEATETVTIFTDGDSTMCRYVLGILHSRLCNFFLYKYCFNNSKLTLHVDAKYLKKIPFIVDDENFDIILEFVSQLENIDYMSDEWFYFYELLNKVVYQIYNITKGEIDFIDNQMKNIQSRKWVNQ
jgi:methylase of polypeptide subunit release factors